MRAAVLRRSGAAPSFDRFREPPCPSLGTLINVVAAAVRPGDRAHVQGRNDAHPRRLPLIPNAGGIASICRGYA